MTTSKKFSLKGVESKIIKGLIISISGAVATYLASMPETIDFGIYAPIITSLSSFAVAAIYQWQKEIS